MATDLSRNKQFGLKKKKSVFYAELDYSDILTSAEVYQLARLPKEIIVTRAAIGIITAFNSATSASAVIGLNSGNGLKTASDLKSVANTVLDSGAIGVRSAVGAILAITPTYVGAPTAGKIYVLVEYVEYTRTDGELTSYV